MRHALAYHCAHAAARHQAYTYTLLRLLLWTNGTLLLLYSAQQPFVPYAHCACTACIRALARTAATYGMAAALLLRRAAGYCAQRRISAHWRTAIAHNCNALPPPRTCLRCGRRTLLLRWRETNLQSFPTRGGRNAWRRKNCFFAPCCCTLLA